MSISRVQAAVATASQGITLSAANLNFDFTLIKFDAPAEYRALGAVLSPSRVREAETGPLHVTARRLGALFDGVCPETPNLIKAYGTRASDISLEVSARESAKDSNWVRSEYGGIDATSIWAAATSSKAALPVHLLACIIARIWNNTEAVSIWDELVVGRRSEIAAKFEQGEMLPDCMVFAAAQQEMTRDHLARWDASARAWLQSADLARRRQLTQFRLIVENVSIAVGSKTSSLYADVVGVWTSALTAMEGLVSGRPHVVKDGTVLLGLSAWHIYPDMAIFDGAGCNKLVPMKDDLVGERGLLSLGLSDAGRQEDRGVYWSLSLAHHRFYGAAPRHTRRLDVDGSRITFSELMLVCYGCLLRRWSSSYAESGLESLSCITGTV
ncbi:hypothetical protein CDD83_9334 [Cordyceps sp. RAO-2017]|nr:hypothetical protein CDD83_9334 [Cordyceps sp. RAO-2017]